MCDSIANGPAPYLITINNIGSSTPPANVTITNNVLSTTGNVIAGNVISGDGTFTGNLYIKGTIYGNFPISTLNATTINTVSLFSTNANLTTLNVANIYTTNIFVSGTANVTTLSVGSLFGSGNNLTNVQSSSITQPFSNLVVSNSVTTTNIYASDSVTTTNLTASLANVTTLNVTSLETVSNLTASLANVPPPQTPPQLPRPEGSQLLLFSSVA